MRPFAVNYVLLMSVCVSLLEALGCVARWHVVVSVDEDAAHPVEPALVSANA